MHIDYSETENPPASFKYLNEVNVFFFCLFVFLILNDWHVFHVTTTQKKKKSPHLLIRCSLFQRSCVLISGTIWFLFYVTIKLFGLQIYLICMGSLSGLWFPWYLIQRIFLHIYTNMCAWTRTLSCTLVSILFCPYLYEWSSHKLNKILKALRSEIYLFHQWPTYKATTLFQS